MDINHLSKLIQMHRKRAGLTQAALAQLAGVGKTVVFDIEHGKPTIQLQTLLRILDVLNIKMELKSSLQP